MHWCGFDDDLNDITKQQENTLFGHPQRMAREGRSNGSEDDDWSMPVSIVHILGRRALSSAASALTIRAQLVAQLEQNTFPRLQAERLVEVLDAAVCEAYASPG